MTTLREAAQMASSPCEYCGHDLPKGVDKKTRQERSYHFEKCDKRPCLAPQPEQEPIAWIVITKDGLEWEDNHTIHPVKQNGDWFQFPVYLPSQRERIMCGCGDQIMPDDGAECGTCVTARNATQREWQGLTEMEVLDICNFAKGQNGFFFVREVEAKLKEKNS